MCVCVSVCVGGWVRGACVRACMRVSECVCACVHVCVHKHTFMSFPCLSTNNNFLPAKNSCKPTSVQVNKIEYKNHESNCNEIDDKAVVSVCGHPTQTMTSES